MARRRVVGAAQGCAQVEEDICPQRWVGPVEQLQGAQRPVEVPHGGLEGQLVRRPRRRPPGDLDRSQRVTGEGAFAVVVGQRVEGVVRTGSGLHGLAHGPVHAHPAVGAELLVERRPDQRVGEAVPADRAADLLEHRRLGGLVEGVEQDITGRAARSLDHREVELGADDRRPTQGVVGDVRQARQASADHLADAFGDADLGEGEVAGPVVVALHEEAGLHQVAQHLAHEERVALGLGVHRSGQLHRGGLERMAGGRLHERGDAAAVEADQVQPADPGLPAEIAEGLGQRVGPVEVGVPVGGQDEHPQRGDRPQEVAEQEQRRLVGPVEVVEHQDHRVGLRRGRQQVGDGLEHAVALGIGLGPQRLGQAGHPVGQLGEQSGQLAGEGPELVSQALPPRWHPCSGAGPRRRARTVRPARDRSDPRARWRPDRGRCGRSR